MDFNKEIDKLVSAGIQTIKNSPDLRNLMYRVYGALFLESGTPASCGSKDEAYFSKILADGKKKASKYESVSARTLVFRSNGKIFLPKAGVTFNLDLIDDDKAIEMLNKGWLSRQAFIKMPDGYVEKDGRWVKTEEKDMADLDEYVKNIKAARQVSETTTETKDYTKRMKELVGEGLSSKEIADKLNSEGYVTKKGKPFTISAVNGLKSSLA